ncbi:MAG: zinc ribbon domain-containing protein [Deltaproteobacteria bacterium]|nr:zinc ribbon domain-containing protein [Deltaproteobacteria bacterium]
MPIYEYKCKKCGTVFERIVSANTTDKVSCAKCGSNIVQKIISAASLRLSSSSAAAIPLGAHSGCASPSGFS